MSKIRIVTDSSITIEPELVEKYNITVVPLSVMVDGVIYSDSDLREEGRFLLNQTGWISRNNVVSQ